MKSKIFNHCYKSYEKKDRIAILGFGREGKSAYRTFRTIFPKKILTIIDRSEETKERFGLEFEDENIKFVFGEKYLSKLADYDLIIRSPGVSLRKHPQLNIVQPKLTSLTEIFIAAVGDRVIGITGTKGKSTTTNLIYEIFKSYYPNTHLAGNIGIPVFDILDELQEDSYIIYELSSHQLSQVTVSPKYAILLNIFQEHLDFYNSYKDYQDAKLNIFRYQSEGDFAIYGLENPVLQERAKEVFQTTEIYGFTLMKINDGRGCSLKEGDVYYKGKDQNYSLTPIESVKYLKGKHNLLNVMAAIIVSKLCKIPDTIIIEGLEKFRGLPHRMEYVGKFDEIDFYNDSIATIPEATIAAMKAIPDVETLILGGMDRGIDYSLLIDFLIERQPQNLILVGEVGDILHEKLSGKISSGLFWTEDYEGVVQIAYQQTPRGKACLLSPAASSYDQFKNFEQRGEIFKALIKSKSEII